MRIFTPLLIAALAFSCPALAGGVKVDHAWVRSTLPGQKVAGGFMDIAADQDMELVGATTPVAQSVELHFMRMAGGEMEMRELKSIPLPKGKTVSLEPGGLHAMLIGIKAPIKAGDKVPMSLTFNDSKGNKTHMDISMRVIAREY